MQSTRSQKIRAITISALALAAVVRADAERGGAPHFSAAPRMSFSHAQSFNSRPAYAQQPRMQQMRSNYATQGGSRPTYHPYGGTTTGGSNGVITAPGQGTTYPGTQPVPGKIGSPAPIYGQRPTTPTNPGPIHSGNPIVGPSPTGNPYGGQRNHGGGYNGYNGHNGGYQNGYNYGRQGYRNGNFTIYPRYRSGFGWAAGPWLLAAEIEAMAYVDGYGWPCAYFNGLYNPPIYIYDNGYGYNDNGRLVVVQTTNTEYVPQQTYVPQTAVQQTQPDVQPTRIPGPVPTGYSAADQNLTNSVNALGSRVDGLAQQELRDVENLGASIDAVQQEVHNNTLFQNTNPRPLGHRAVPTILNEESGVNPWIIGGIVVVGLATAVGAGRYLSDYMSEANQIRRDLRWERKQRYKLEKARYEHEHQMEKIKELNAVRRENQATRDALRASASTLKT